MSHDRLFDSESAAAAFSAALKTQRIGKRLHYFSLTSSTNDLALQAARGGAPDGTLFVADQQESGRGRRGRVWESRPGLGLLFSVALDAGMLPQKSLSWIPIAAGLACVEGLDATTSVRPVLKWPNDVVIPATRSIGSCGWRKLGGILCESFFSAESGGRSAVVAGVGLNIQHTQEDLPEFAKAPPTSVALETGAPADACGVFAAVLEAFERNLDVLRHEDGSGRMRARAEESLRSWWQPQMLLSVQGGGTDEDLVSGRFAGLNESGWLRLKLRDGSERIFADAEIISVR